MPEFNAAFKRWFKNSTVVDKRGRPLIVYHVTNQEDFTEFRTINLGQETEVASAHFGAWFTADRDSAEDSGFERVIRAYLSFQNPYRMPVEEFDPYEYDEVSIKNALKRRRELEKEGFDGIYIEEYGWYCAFYPEQIKAVDNDGTWDADDPDIRSNPEPPVWLDEFLSVGGQLTPDGKKAVVFHGTTKAKASKALSEGLLRSPLDAPDSYGVYVSSSSNISRDYGDGTVLVLEVLLEDLHPDDVFPGERLDFSIPTRRHVYRPSAMGIL